MTTMTELERLERRLEGRWYDLTLAERRGQPLPVLERMYNAYLRALDELVDYQRTSASQRSPGRLAS
jgi:hypothetical protein